MIKYNLQEELEVSMFSLKNWYLDTFESRLPDKVPFPVGATKKQIFEYDSCLRKQEHVTYVDKVRGLEGACYRSIYFVLKDNARKSLNNKLDS